MGAPEAASPAETLAELAADLAAGRLPPPQACAWLAACVEGYLEQGIALEAALDLRPGLPGHEIAATRYRRARRDDHLRRAHAMMSGPTPWGRTVQLDAELRRFESRVWPQWRNLAAPPPGASELRVRLWHAARLGALPRLRQLHAISAAVHCTQDDGR